MALVVKTPPANAGDSKRHRFDLGREDALEKEIAAHSSILAWRVAWAEESGRLWSMGVTKSQT